MNVRCLSGLIWFGFLGISACAPRTELLRPEPVAQESFSPTERWLVMRFDASQAMDLVKNDTPAGDQFLRTRSLVVDLADPNLGHLVERMLASVRAEKGVGIAAPQVGINRRVVVVQRLDLAPEQPYRTYFNPEIVGRSVEQVRGWEGCLSIPAGFGQVMRAESITVAYDAPGGRRREQVRGFTARIFQHEIDHLDGVLFIDRKDPGPLLPEAEYRQMRLREQEKQKD